MHHSIYEGWRNEVAPLVVDDDDVLRSSSCTISSSTSSASFSTCWRCWDSPISTN
ncbi:hypothetical protein Sjap_008190 [Stephania japonica]|uniref:Uncharacterized protein n=1 Tax=Stephania japonica TaxID=461633 RepID=A0AAP0JPV3_9MAGN